MDISHPMLSTSTYSIYLEFYEWNTFQDNILFGSGGSSLVLPNSGWICASLYDRMPLFAKSLLRLGWKRKSIYLVSFGVCVHISNVTSSEDGRMDMSSTDLATIRSNQISARREMNHSNRLKSEVLHFRWTSSKIQFPKLSVILVDHYLPLVSAPPQP